MITDYLVVAEVVRNALSMYPDTTEEELHTKIKEGLVLHGIPSSHHPEWKGFIQLIIDKSKSSQVEDEDGTTVSPN